MSQPLSNSVRPNSVRGRDGLIIGFVMIAAILSMAFLSDTSAYIALLITGLALGTLYLYFRFLRTKSHLDTSDHQDSDLGEPSDKTLERLADSIPRAVAILNESGTVTHANSAAKNLLAPDMVGRPAVAYLRSSEFKQRLDDAFSGKDNPPLTLHILAPTEKVIDVDFSKPVSKRPVSKNDPTQNEQFVFAVLADRTEANLAREKQADFLANASHELKTPIASLKGYIETLRGHAKDDPEARDVFLGIMQDQAERMERLVTDLLSLRKIESREHITPSETADLSKAIGSALDILSPLAAARKISLEVNTSNIGPARIFGKTDECVQLFLNLMENAIKLSPLQSTVMVSLDHMPTWNGDAFAKAVNAGASTRRIVNLPPSQAPAWRVTISDQGPGFSRTHLPRIGERFYRVAGDLSAQEKGTGLGLAIVKHIVMRHRAGLFVQTIHKDDHENLDSTNKSDLNISGSAFSVIFIDRSAHSSDAIEEEE